MKQIGALALILIGSVLLMGQAIQKKSIDADEFVLKDSRGKARGKLYMETDGPRLALLDLNGVTRTELFLSQDRIAGLRMPDGNGDSRIMLFAHDEDALLTFRGSKTGIRIGLGTVKDTPELNFYDANQKSRALMYTTPDGSPKLELYHANENLGATLAVPGLAFLDADKKPRAFLAQLPEGAFLTVTDKEGFETTVGTKDLVTSRTGETHKTSAASVVLFDKDKNVLWKAP